MKTRIHIAKRGADHVELQVDSEAAADRVADEANKMNFGPVIGQHRNFEKSGKHYVVLNGVADDIVNFLQEVPEFELV